MRGKPTLNHRSELTHVLRSFMAALIAILTSPTKTRRLVSRLRMQMFASSFLSLSLCTPLKSGASTTSRPCSQLLPYWHQSCGKLKSAATKRQGSHHVHPYPDSNGLADNYNELYPSNRWKDPSTQRDTLPLTQLWNSTYFPERVRRQLPTAYGHILRQEFMVHLISVGSSHSLLLIMQFSRNIQILCLA